MKQKTKEDTLNFIRLTANHQGWKPTKDREMLEFLAESLTGLYNRLGYYQCPCRDFWGEREKDRDIICPCNYAGQDIDEFGHCYCSLFLNRNISEEQLEPKSIPDRRPEEMYP